jgi:CheY-like chemotaxis protein
MSKRRTVVPSRILVVDDQVDILDIVVRVLTGAGYACDTAPHGDVALARLADTHYDLVISNLRMPVMDGEALYRHLRVLHPDLKDRIIFCTGDTATPAAQSFLRTTGAPVLLKPFELTALLEAVGTKLGRDLPRAHAPYSTNYWQDTVAIPA